MRTYRPWQIVHVHLDDVIPELPAHRGIGGAYAVFWWRDLPLGLDHIAPEELPLTAHELRERGLRSIAGAVERGLEAGQWPTDRVVQPVWKNQRPLETLSALIDARSAAASALTASVVICTRDRPDMLARCLQSLGPALDPTDEIVVVDNAPSSQATQQRVRDWPRARYVLEPRGGLDIARNRGIRESRGDLVVYCDDDVVVEANWLRRLKTAFLEPKVAAAMGLVLPASLQTEAQYVFETHWGFKRGFMARDYGPRFFQEHFHRGAPVWEIGAGASMALRRSVLCEVGGFDERLDAGAAGCSGDSEMWYRILAAGNICRYEPAAVSYHWHREEMHELERQIFNYMRGHATALLIQFEHNRHWGNLRRLLLSLPAYYARKTVHRALGSDVRRLRTLPYEIRGWLAGIRYYLAQPRQRPPVVVVDGNPMSVS